MNDRHSDLKFEIGEQNSAYRLILFAGYIPAIHDLLQKRKERLGE